MKQVVQNYKNGEVSLLTVPAPTCADHSILVRTAHSLISLGTERSIIQLGQKSLLGKARARPDLVKRVIEKAKNEGIKKTFQEAMGRLETSIPLGYSASGFVVEAGVSASLFSPGDRVAVIGQGIASHAEFLHVPLNMACRIPDNVSNEAAAFGMLGTIALHGIRKANIEFGSHVIVIGAGLLGLLSLLILKAYGCSVSIIDIVPEKIALAKKLGADIATTHFSELANAIEAQTNAFGADACLITASTDSDRPVNEAVALLRRAAKLVLVGVADIHPNRQAMWEKECELVVSRASGPGSLDPIYEEDGVDLPIDIARWTPQRNLAEFLRLLSTGAIDLSDLITHRFPLNQAESVYESVSQNKLNGSIGVLFDYVDDAPLEKTMANPDVVVRQQTETSVGVSVVGAGIFAKSLLLPEISNLENVQLKTLVTATGASAQLSAKRFAFEKSSTDVYSVFADRDTHVVIAAAPHHMHADLVLKSLQQNKDLWIEKPLCIDQDELKAIESEFFSANEVPIIQVGHNRRYSPHSLKIKSWLAQCKQPLLMQYRVNAGFISPEHWVHKDAEGRSRIVGEMSHFIDWMQFITGETVKRVFAERISGNEKNIVNNDNVIVTLKLSGGSLATLNYTASGHRALSRESIEIFCDGLSIRSTDFRVSECFSAKGKRRFKTRGQSLGYREALHHFMHCVRGLEKPTVSLLDELQTMSVVFNIEAALAKGMPICIS